MHENYTLIFLSSSIATAGKTRQSLKIKLKMSVNGPSTKILNVHLYGSTHGYM